MAQPKHIEVRCYDTGPAIVVDDYELFDFVDDLMVELGFESLFMSEEVVSGRKLFRLHFPKVTDPTVLESVIRRIPDSTVQQMYDLNN